ncbi:MAG: peptidase M14 [Blastocatellia bacterium]|nr:peptidase M14 [Blastocatellia bacterium]
MKLVFSLALVMAIFTAGVFAQTAAELAEIWEKEHITNILPSNTRHKDLIKYLDDLRTLGIKVSDVGRSYQNREIYQLEFGSGPLKVFMWSQMHGDEPTATPALIDMFTVLQKNRDKEWVKQIEKTITLRAVPMLNPDGADLFIRRNIQGIDINRDALDLKTPEARILKSLRDTWEPEIGFNLHNQNALTAAGRTNKQAAISFLVVYGDAEKTETEGHIRNKRLVAAMTQALQNFIPGHIGRYGDEWTPTAFGDSFSAWGTPTILIETGGLHREDEMYLVKLNFIAFMTALKALADGSEKNFSPANYDLIPRNAGGQLMNVIIRNATIIDPLKPNGPTVADLGINFERRRDQLSTPAFIRRIGELTSIHGLEEFDASGFYVVGRFDPIKTGSRAELLFFRRDRTIDWAATETPQPEPDAIFSTGRWFKGEGVVPKK